MTSSKQITGKSNTPLPFSLRGNPRLHLIFHLYILLFQPQVREAVARFFEREDTFGLGICNGCQMLATLRDLIPGTSHWPRFERNLSEQFEARVALVEVLESPSIFLRGMAGSVLPIPVAHGEGRAVFKADSDQVALETEGQVALRYVDPFDATTEVFPYNPNGSPSGITGLTNADGRVTIMMPHPERVFRTVTNSWHPPTWQEDGPWLRMFRNARVWVG